MSTKASAALIAALAVVLAASTAPDAPVIISILDVADPLVYYVLTKSEATTTSVEPPDDTARRAQRFPRRRTR